MARTLLLRDAFERLPATHEFAPHLPLSAGNDNNSRPETLPAARTAAARSPAPVRAMNAWTAIRAPNEMQGAPVREISRAATAMVQEARKGLDGLQGVAMPRFTAAAKQAPHSAATLMQTMPADILLGGMMAMAAPGSAAVTAALVVLSGLEIGGYVLQDRSARRAGSTRGDKAPAPMRPSFDSVATALRHAAPSQPGYYRRVPARLAEDFARPTPDRSGFQPFSAPSDTAQQRLHAIYADRSARVRSGQDVLDVLKRRATTGVSIGGALERAIGMDYDFASMRRPAFNGAII